MKALLIFIALFVSSIAAAQDSTLVVTLTGLESDEGSVLVALYDNASDWGKPLVAKYVRIAPASRGSVAVEFAYLQPGRYSIAAVHDLDDSGDMTYNLIGIPKEAYGFSNNVRGTLSMPSFEACLFEFERTGELTIELK